MNLDDDVAAAVAELRAKRGIGLSEAVNELVRAGLAVPRQRKPFVQKTANVGVRITHFARFTELTWVNPLRGG